jgi:hypothetical protein
VQAATCKNVLPVTKPGIRFACPDNRQFDPEKTDNVMPSDDNCCSKVGRWGDTDALCGIRRSLHF